MPYIVVLGTGQGKEPHQCHAALVGPLLSTADAQSALDLYLKQRPDLKPRIEECTPISSTWILLLGSQDPDNPHAKLQAVSLHHTEPDAKREHANICHTYTLSQAGQLDDPPTSGCWCLITKLTPHRNPT